MFSRFSPRSILFMLINVNLLFCFVSYLNLQVKGDPSKKELKKENDEKSSSRGSGDKKNMSDRSSK